MVIKSDVIVINRVHNDVKKQLKKHELSHTWFTFDSSGNNDCFLRLTSVKRFPINLVIVYKCSSTKKNLSCRLFGNELKSCFLFSPQPDGRKQECVFVEEFLENNYTALVSAKYKGWYLGFNRKGRPKKGSRTTQRQQEVHFMKRQPKGQVAPLEEFRFTTVTKRTRRARRLKPNPKRNWWDRWDSTNFTQTGGVGKSGEGGSPGEEEKVRLKLKKKKKISSFFVSVKRKTDRKKERKNKKKSKMFYFCISGWLNIS